MFSRKVNNSKKQVADPIRWRSHEVGRIEAFTDAVFAFAVTLLIVSLEVPDSFDKLIHDLLGFVPFGLGFLFLFHIWGHQHRFFRRFGLHDDYTNTLNAILIFVILYFVYPLKFLASFLVKMVFEQKFIMEPTEVYKLMILYSAGFVLVYVLLALMYVHALKRRGQLDLSEAEVFETRTTLYDHLTMICFGLASILLAIILPQAPFFSGIIYAFVGIPLTILRSKRGRLHRLKFETITEGHKPVVQNSPLK